MTYFEFNDMRWVGSLENTKNQFYDPLGICFEYQLLNVCDFGNEKIKVFDNHLGFIKSVKVDYSPEVVKATILSLFVQALYSYHIFIYELNSLNLTQKMHNPGVCSHLIVINSNLYQFNSKSKSVLPLCLD